MRNFSTKDLPETPTPTLEELVNICSVIAALTETETQPAELVEIAKFSSYQEVSLILQYLIDLGIVFEGIGSDAVPVYSLAYPGLDTFGLSL